MLSGVAPGELRPANHKVANELSTCGLTSVAELQVPTGATAGESGSLGELPILRSQYVARGVRVLFGSRWRFHRFQERTIALQTGEKPSITIFAAQGDASRVQPETTHDLALGTICELIDGNNTRATGLQLNTSGSFAFRLRIRFATAADANIWCSIVRETLQHAKWSRDIRPVKQQNSTHARNIRIVQHEPSSERFVVKVLTANGEGDCQELQILRRLYSSRFAQDVELVRGYRVVQTSNEVLLIMPQLPGLTLLQLLQKRRKSKQFVENEEAWSFVGQLAKLLQAVHQTGIVHSDLNLENVLFSSDFSRTWLIDFGGAFDLLDGQNSTHRAQQMTGTPGYVAPERVQNPLVPATPKSDVFSFGVLLFQVLAEQHPYFDATSEKRALQLEDSLRLDWRRAEALLKAKAVPSELHELLRGMLEPDPRVRISLDEILGAARRNS